MRKEPDRRSFLLPPLSLNCRLRDPGRSSFAGLKSPACPAQQRCSAAVAAVRPPGGPGGVLEKNEDRKGWQGAGPKPQKDTSLADHEG